MSRYEKSPFQPNCYVVHDGNGYAFRAFKHGAQGWRAFPAHSARAYDMRAFQGATLTACAQKVENCTAFSSAQIEC